MNEDSELLYVVSYVISDESPTQTERLVFWRDWLTRVE